MPVKSPKGFSGPGKLPRECQYYTETILGVPYRRESFLISQQPDYRKVPRKRGGIPGRYGGIPGRYGGILGRGDTREVWEDTREVWETWQAWLYDRYDTS